MRKYSVEEIDEMRSLLYEIYQDFSGKNYEEMLRTYMVNGTDPAELEEKARQVQEVRRKEGFYHGV